MLNMANIVTGRRVLDVAAGTGEQTILAARRVGPTGSVLATDIAAEMLTIAAETAYQAGLSNVTTHAMDARHVDVDTESFDAAICRLGLMFILGLGKLYRRTGDGARAEEHLTTSRAMYGEMDMGFWLEKAEAAAAGGDP